MERMGNGRQDTWAEWKAAVLALSDEAMHRYLEDIEGFTPDRVSSFIAHDAVILPEDWSTTDAARQAVLRFFAFKRDVLDGGGPGGALESQEARAAALPPSDDPDPNSVPAPRAGDERTHVRGSVE